jgi:hypothetical protein
MATSWLEACDEVQGPLGIVGHSLGGQVGLFNLACDPRLRAGVLRTSRASSIPLGKASPVSFLSKAGTPFRPFREDTPFHG